jgi:hypothetical protein
VSHCSEDLSSFDWTTKWISFIMETPTRIVAVSSAMDSVPHLAAKPA